MPKSRKCKCGCGQPIPDGNTLRKAATVECAIALARRATELVERKLAAERRRQSRADKRRLKPRSQWMREAQAAVNAYVRSRDAEEPCICCRRHHQGQWHAGHYRSVGAHPALRFEPLNIHKSCQPCNTHLSGNLIEYRKNLIAKIGLQKVEWLEGPHAPRNYTIEELKEIIKTYRAMKRELENAQR